MTKKQLMILVGLLLVVVALSVTLRWVALAQGRSAKEQLLEGELKAESSALVPGRSQFYWGYFITISTGSTYTIKLFSEGVCVQEWRRASEVRPSYRLAQVTFLDSSGHAAAAYGIFSLV